jgi:hypothetical protein
MAQIKMSSFPNTSRQLIYQDFSGGLNYRDNPSLIVAKQTPECQNVRVRDGTIGKRPGYKRVFPASLGMGEINGLFQYIKADGTKFNIIAWGTNLYTQVDSDQPVLIKSGLANSKASFFVLADVMYMLNGTDFISFDGIVVSDVRSYAYNPLVLIGRSPTGAPNFGTTNERFNLLSAGFSVAFSADGTATAYTLPYASLDSTTIIAVVNGTILVENTDFTVNRTTGVVTFNTAPTTGTNNVIITAFKASLGNPEYILNCTIAEVYGGKTSATVFFSGNPNFPDQVFHSRLYGSNYNADYFPDDGWQKIPGNVSGLAHIYDLLYVSHSKGHGYLSYQEGDTYPYFPYSDINLEKGSDIPGSIQEIDNSVVCASTTDGVMQVQSNTTVNNRLSVSDISDLVNKSGSGRTDIGILIQPNLNNAISYNFDGYYGLCVNDVCYVWDYKLNAWLFDTNIPASCFAVIDGFLCFGSNTEGLVYRFDPFLANDDGEEIDSWYDLKEEHAGTPTMMKVLSKVDLISKPLNRSSTLLSFRSRGSNSDVILAMPTTAFSFVGFCFENFTFNTSFYPVVRKKRMSKRANYFQFRFSNNVLDEGMSVISLIVQYDQGSEIR